MCRFKIGLSSPPDFRQPPPTQLGDKYSLHYGAHEHTFNATDKRLPTLDLVQGELT